MHPQICVFTDNPPSERHAAMIKKFTSVGLLPLVDSIHKEPDWFVKQFTGIEHRCFYNQPYLLQGVIEEIKFNIMGIPDYVVYYTTPEPGEKVLTTEQWHSVIGVFNFWLNQIDIPDELYESAVELLVPADRNEQIGGTSFEPVENPLVMNRELHQYYYGFQMHELAEIDACLVQVTKPFTERPFTLMIHKFSQNGYLPLFGDLFASSDWGSSFADVCFLEKLWARLEMEGPFDMEAILKRATESCYPNETSEVRAEPKIYRKSIQEFLEGTQLMGLKINV